ncbi:MAG: hypothetical protein ABIG20_02055 [archaeon]
MAVEVITAMQYFVGHQVPLFLLIFGLLYTAMAFVFKPLAQLAGVPIGVLCIATSLAWFIVSGGGIMAIPVDVMQVVGVGMVVLVVGKVFAG